MNSYWAINLVLIYCVITLGAHPFSANQLQYPSRDTEAERNGLSQRRLTCQSEVHHSDLSVRVNMAQVGRRG